MSYTSCPTDQLCMTLENYTRLHNLTTGMELIFLPGNHSLLKSILTLENVSNITLKGEKLATIVCTNEIIIQCENVSDLKIKGLIFLQNFTDQYKLPISTIYLMNSHGVVISNTTFKGVGTIKAKIIILECSTVTIMECIFKNNKGGIIYASAGTSLSITGSHFTENTGSRIGGVILIQDSNLVLYGNLPNIFTHNSARNNGGAISCYNCTLTMSGNNTFYNHSVLYESNTYLSEGGTIYMKSGRLILSGIVYISHSTAVGNGGAIKLYDSEAILNGTSIVFHGNEAEAGGGISAELSSVNSITERVYFIENTAYASGGAIEFFNYHTSFEIRNREVKVFLSGHFVNNTGSRGGAIYASSVQMTLTNVNMINNSNAALNIRYSNTTFNGVSRITRSSDGGILAEHSSLIVEGYVLFDNNSNYNGGALNCFQGTLSLSGYILFTNNRADYDGGAIYAVGTSIYIQNQVDFSFNTAGRSGGALFFYIGASLTLKIFPVERKINKVYHIKKYSELNTKSNFASHYGGVIYHADSPTIRQCYQVTIPMQLLKMPYCFLQLEGSSNYNDLLSIKIKSYNDSAGKDGSFLFGGLLNRCSLKSESYLSGKQYFLEKHHIIRINTTTKKSKLITSQPYQLCFCEKNKRHFFKCKKTLSVEVHRGEKFTLPLLASAQVGITSTQVRAITSPTAKLEINQTSQYLPNQCHSLLYTLYSTESHEEVVLYPDGPCRDTGTASVLINATILPCPDGFTQKDEDCICDIRLHRYSVSCTIADIPYVTKAVDNKVWVGVLHTNATYEGLILGSPCPFEYCKRDAVNLTLDNTDIQCSYNHGGLLCGGCVTNHSLMLGGSQCQVCSNAYLVLLLPFAVAGILLIVLLTSLRLTVAIGSLNSVILYTNIIQANQRILFPANTKNGFTVFLAWVNLDFGFQTCFYDGLDPYGQTWLQFSFPLYVWLLIGLIIFISRYSITVSKLIGHNPIAVLATLILMSYTKLLKIIIEVYSSVDLDYPGNKTVTVWLKDANVPYLQTRHLALTAVTTLIVVFFFLPYTLLLMFGFKLYHLSGRKYFSWITNIKPLLDSYYAPYKIHTRYWTGLLLLVRCALYVVFSMNSISTKKNFFAIIMVFTVLGFVMGMLYSGKIYKNLYTNILEGLIYSNLIMLSAAKLAIISSLILVYLLVGVVFIIMTCICAHQFHLQCVVKTALWFKVKKKFFHYRMGSRRDPQIRDDLDSVKALHDPHKIITRAVIELREPLIEN